MAEIRTAGTTILIEFRKYGARPSQRTPVQAVLQALAQGAKVISAGGASMVPTRSSSSSLTEVASMT